MNGAGVESKRRRLARYAIVVAIVSVLAGIFVQREFRADGEAVVADGRPDVGLVAPDFVLGTDDGDVRLSDLRGRIVVLNFWASWCGPCRLEMPEFQELHEARGDEIYVLAVNLASADSRGAAREFVADFGLSFTIAYDVTGAVAEAYGVHALPATFFVDRDGVLRARTYGPVLGDRLQENLAAAGG